MPSVGRLRESKRPAFAASKSDQTTGFMRAGTTPFVHGGQRFTPELRGVYRFNFSTAATRFDAFSES